jgi:hypothetical protein
MAGKVMHGRLRWLSRLPLVASRHATVSTVPRFHEDGQTARPGIKEGCIMTEAAVRHPLATLGLGGLAEARLRLAMWVASS